MLSKVSNVSPTSSYKISSDLVISSWNLLTNPDNLVQSCRGYTVVDSKKTKGQVIADFHVKSTGRSEAVLANAENSKASRNVGGQSAALTATCSSDHLDTEPRKYDTGDKITRQARLSKSKKPETINSVALSEDQICNNDFNVKGDLVRHTKTHGTKRSFKCDMCDREFIRLDHLKKHARTHTGERPFQCEECGKTFTQKNNLTKHKRVHTGERPFPCDECDKKFTQKNNLIKHKRIHSGERPFQCNECKRRFICMDSLEKHKRVHTGERPFPCDVCEKTFARKHHLIDHKKIHTGKRPFQCEECDKRFTKKYNLTEHKKTHTDKYHFKCKECGKGFLRKSRLDNHTFSHSSTPPFKCDVCDNSFYHKSSLTRHVCNNSKKHPHKANKKSSKISRKRFTNDRNPGQPEPDHNNEKSFKSSHRNASFTSTATSNQHIKPKNHTTNSETGLTNPGNFSTITQLPSASNQPSTSDIHVNKSQNQEKYGEYSEYAETVALLNELADTYPITLEPGSFEHHDDLFLDQEMPEETFPDRQNANADCLITQLHPVVDWPSTSGIHVDKSQDQEKCEETVELLDYDYLQTVPPPPQPSWNSGYPLGYCDGDDFLCQNL